MIPKLRNLFFILQLQLPANGGPVDVSAFQAYNICESISTTRMWANAQPDGHPAEHRWRPLFNAAKFG